MGLTKIILDEGRAELALDHVGCGDLLLIVLNFLTVLPEI
jgi:hypothetical protein